MFKQCERFNYTEKTPWAGLWFIPVLHFHRSNCWIVGFGAAGEIADFAIKISWREKKGGGTGPFAREVKHEPHMVMWPLGAHSRSRRALMRESTDLNKRLQLMFIIFVYQQSIHSSIKASMYPSIPPSIQPSLYPSSTNPHPCKCPSNVPSSIHTYIHTSLT